MYGGSHILSFVIVDDFDIESVALAKLKANPPALIDCHSPLLLSIALELMEPEASEWTEILKAGRGVQRHQQFHSGLDIQATKMIGRLTVPKLSSG
jgi:hypothetical protein